VNSGVVEGEPPTPVLAYSRSLTLWVLAVAPLKKYSNWNRLNVRSVVLLVVRVIWSPNSKVGVGGKYCVGVADDGLS